MTPQERQLVAELFDRLASLESGPRDPDAERAIADGLQRAPHGTYALVQTVLLQDEALKRCHSRIQELEGGPAEEPSRGFLDSMRESLFGRDEPRGSVPPVRPGGAGTSGAWGQPGGGPGGAGTSGVWGQPGGAPPQAGPAPGMAPIGAPPIGTGGSFLGNAASTAAGVIGGAMLLNGIRSMFGHSGGAGGFGSGAAVASPWGGSPASGSAANSDLARDAGLDNIGRDRSGGRDDDTGRTGLFGGDDRDDGDPLGPGDDGYGDAGDDSDFDGDFDGGDTEDV